MFSGGGNYTELFLRVQSSALSAAWRYSRGLCQMAVSPFSCGLGEVDGAAILEDSNETRCVGIRNES